MPDKKKKNDMVKISGRHKAHKGDKALVIKSKHTGWHFRPLKKKK
jgi:hypothetical protein